MVVESIIPKKTISNAFYSYMNQTVQKPLKLIPERNFLEPCIYGPYLLLLSDFNSK